MNFSRIINLRKDNDLSQEQIAHKLGVSRQTYSLWELGIKIIPLKHLYSLCKFYNVSMDYILFISDEKKHNIIKFSKISKKNIGNNIKTIRQECQLTLAKLAKELNTTTSTISAYEHGKTMILTAFAFQICKKYHYSLDWLIGTSNK